MDGLRIETEGLVELVAALKGKEFRDVNFALREHAAGIAAKMLPDIALLVSMSPAPQARAMSKTLRVKRDRVPVVSIGKVNPRFDSEKTFTRKGSDSKRRRGAIAHGVVYGPLGGRRDTDAAENYYRIPRDNSGGRLGESLRTGPALKAAEQAYLRAYINTLQAAGFDDARVVQP